ncbi:hypothetical protein AAIH68_35695, partial [Pseudomonas aeruginosa]|uniref:hypothetical protein n=1 Tax=Pseudomonas aeruginosa TaxID=287 RepID=UPI0031B794F2
ITTWVAARVMGRLAPQWGVQNALRVGMVCLMAGGLLLAAGEALIPLSLLGFIAPMWLVGVGIATAVSVTPNGAQGDRPDHQEHLPDADDPGD